MDREFIDKLLKAGVGYGASDIHFKVGSAPSYRVDGTLRSLKAEPLKPSDTVAIVKLLCARASEPPDVETLREFDTSYSVPGTARFRVNVYR